MAQDLTTRSAPAAAAPSASVRSTARSVFRSRFAIAYLALAVVAGAALGATVLLLLDPPEKQQEMWSSWRPPEDNRSYAEQIADHVSGRYRLPSGNPLVGIMAGPPQVQTREGGVPIQAVAIQNHREGASEDIKIVRTDNSIMYTLCGLGPQCSIREGRPSRARMRLLRREALELALYSFRYIEDVSSVIALLPTNLGNPTDPADDTSTALFFQKGELDQELDDPLRRSLLSSKPPPLTEVGPDREVDLLTEERLFTYEYTTTQAGGAVIVLDPIPTR